MVTSELHASICLVHADGIRRQQTERDWVLAEFKAGRSPIMLATDVASRGLGMCYLSSSTRKDGLSRRFPQLASHADDTSPGRTVR